MEPKEIETLIDKKIADNNKKLNKQTPVKKESLLSINSRRHQSARRMAWASLIAAFIIAGVILVRVPPELIENYSGYLNAVFLLFGAVIGSYMGFTTWGGNKFFEGKNTEEINGTTTGGNNASSNQSEG